MIRREMVSFKSIITNPKRLFLKRHNDLIDSYYSLSINEHRIIDTLMHKMKTSDEDFKDYIIDLKEFAEFYGLEQTGHLYDSIKDSAARLVKSSIVLKKDKSILFTSWSSHAEYFKSTGTLIVSFHKSLKQHLLQLNKNDEGHFTESIIDNPKELNTNAAHRLYDVLIRYSYNNDPRSKNKEFSIVIPVAEYRNHLCIKSDDYGDFCDFKKRMIDNLIPKVNESTTNIKIISVSYKKKGRRITDIIFSTYRRTVEELDTLFLNNKSI